MVDYTTTPTYAFKMPTDHVNTNTWGGYNNGNWSSVDGLIGSIRGQLGSNYLILTKTNSVEANVQYNGVVGTSKLRWSVGIDDGVESGGDASSNYHINRFDDNGNFIGTPLQINRGSGAVTLNDGLYVNNAATIYGGLGVFGSQTTTGTMAVDGGIISLQQASAGADTTYMLLNASGAYRGSFACLGASGAVGVYTNYGGSSSFYLDSSGTFAYAGGTGTAYKIGGGSWAAISDARIKTVIGDYAEGLEAILQLRPVIYIFKGNDGAPSTHQHVAENDKPFVGFVAQELETVFPSMVTQSPGIIDGQAVSDLRSVDTSELIYALVNAVRELKAEIEELKAARN